MTTMKLKKLTPILWTKNLQETIAFYVDLLSFTCQYQDERFAALVKDDIEIMTIIPIDDPDNCKDSENKEEFFPDHFLRAAFT